MSDKKPFEIARETLKQITVRKLAPTPVNYQAIYNEIAGLPTVLPFPDEPLRRMAQALPTRNPGQEKQRSLMEYAIGQRNWAGVQSALVAYAGFIPTDKSAAVAKAATPVSGSSALTPEFFEQIARLLEYMQPALGADDARFHEQLQGLIASLRDPAAEAYRVKSQLADFGHRLSFAAEDQAEVRQTLLKLLQLIIENIGELSLDDAWLKGQIDALRDAAQPPLTLRRLDDVERRLRDVLFKQAEAKGRALQAQEELRQLLAAFVARLSQVSETSSTYQGKMDESLRQLEQAKRIEEIAPVLKEVMEATRTMAGQAYLLHWAIPNVFFHVTTAYDLLRQAGVPLGKGDYLVGPNA